MVQPTALGHPAFSDGFISSCIGAWLPPDRSPNFIPRRSSISHFGVGAGPRQVAPGGGGTVGPSPTHDKAAPGDPSGLGIWLGCSCPGVIWLDVY